jgi:hypothetical protein
MNYVMMSVRSSSDQRMMKKRLIRVGNSCAIVIDKPIRRILNLGTRTVLEVSTDGTRIIIEPTERLLQDDEIGRARELLSREEGDCSSRAPRRMSGSVKALDADAPKIWLELERRYGITVQHLERLHCAPVPRFTRFAGWMCSPKCASRASNDELGTLQRLKICRDRLRDGVKWEEAIEDALRAVPKPEGVAPSA